MSHILIADDDQFLTGLCSKAFEQSGYETSTANDGHEVMKQLMEKKPDLLLLDLMLPGIDGIEILKFIRANKELEDLAVFILSNSTYFSGIVQSARNEGATKFMRKGEYSPKGLVDEIAKTLPPANAPGGDSNAPSAPSTLSKATDSTEVEGTSKAPEGESRTALIADDDQTIHSVLTYFLGKAGYRIESAFNGLQALEMARQEAPNVLILDVTMPIKDGFETLKEWKESSATQHIPVIMLTSSQSEEVQGKAIGSGADHYLTKPFSPESLVDLADQATLKSTSNTTPS